jgi:hypothetical protein
MVVEVGKFSKVKTSSLTEHGINKGDVVYIAGSGFVPDSKTDPYKYRLTFVACKTDGYKIDSSGGFTIDARNLSKVNQKELAKYEEAKEELARAKAAEKEALPEGN